MPDKPECTCEDNYIECEVHVDCECKALREPETFEEYKAAYEHWKSHSRYGGCSHGC